MTHSEQNYAALNAIGRRCNEQLKQVDKKNLDRLGSIMDSFAGQAELLGFSKLHLKVQIGRINGKLTDRRLD